MSEPLPTPATWADVERALSGLPRPAVATFATRAARRITPVLGRLEARYGPEAREWWNVVNAALRVVQAFAAGEPVTRFTLDLAAELARATATATANAARTQGPSPLIEDAELAYAAVAFAADAARAPTPARAAALATQAARLAANDGPIPAEQIADLRALQTGEELPPLAALEVFENLPRLFELQ